jgi:hypothetical protein
VFSYKEDDTVVSDDCSDPYKIKKEVKVEKTTTS